MKNFYSIPFHSIACPAYDAQGYKAHQMKQKFGAPYNHILYVVIKQTNKKKRTNKRTNKFIA